MDLRVLPLPRGEARIGLTGSEDSLPFLFVPFSLSLPLPLSLSPAPSSLVKSVRATEVMTYERADAGGYLVTVSVATPDVPYGNTFRTEMQFEITPLAGEALNV